MAKQKITFDSGVELCAASTCSNPMMGVIWSLRQLEDGTVIAVSGSMGGATLYKLVPLGVQHDR